MPKSSIVLKMNGATDALVIDGHTFDRSLMTVQQRRGLRDMLREHLFPNAAKMESRAPRHRPSNSRKGAR